MNHFDPTKFYQDAINYLKADSIFRTNTGCDADKATEIVIAAEVNKWLNKNGYAFNIALSSATHGIDGILVSSSSGSGVCQLDGGPNQVEIKSSLHGEFQFAIDFSFNAHRCIVMADFDEGTPNHIYVAIGQRTMRVLEWMAHIDTLRHNFKPGHRARIFANRKVKANIENFKSLSKVRLVGPPPAEPLPMHLDGAVSTIQWTECDGIFLI